MWIHSLVIIFSDLEIDVILWFQYLYYINWELPIIFVFLWFDSVDIKIVCTFFNICENIFFVQMYIYFLDKGMLQQDALGNNIVADIEIIRGKP